MADTGRMYSVRYRCTVPLVGVLEFISTLAGSMAWPVAVVVCVTILRRQIAGLLQRLQTFEIGGQKATFGALGKVEDTVAEVVSNTRRDDNAEGRDSEATDAEWAAVLSRAASSPRTAVLEAWNRLEHDLNVLADAVDPNAPHGWPQVVSGLQILEDWAGLRPALRELRHLRDSAANNPSGPSPVDAARYVSVARALSRSLDAITATVADRPPPGRTAGDKAAREPIGSAG
jgi:hypothetical protein